MTTELASAEVDRPIPVRTAQASRVEEREQRIVALIVLRQHLRDCGANWDELERNRLEIVRLQHELTEALIERHLRPQQAA
jgi:hypothetical protein